jgi:hypothetical protein
MDENKKEYTVVGTVTIGTDEYRDLLTEKFEAERAKEEEHDRWWKCYTEKNELEKTNKKLMEELDKYKKFIKKNSVNISEDSITLFMSMLGEDE